MVEAAWTYRYPARVSEALRVRLCARYRRLNAAGKFAREMAAFLWAIGQEIEPS
ncbi:transposase (fragment) [Mesorhizobium sp. STM 4661]